MYNIGKYHAKCVCPECNESKTLFVVHPQDSEQEVFICSECADYIEYVMGEVISGQATEREGVMYGV